VNVLVPSAWGSDVRRRSSIIRRRSRRRSRRRRRSSHLFNRLDTAVKPHGIHNVKPVTKCDV